MKKVCVVAFMFFSIAIMVIGYSLYEPYTLEIKRYRIKYPALSGLSAVFASDFHIGASIREKSRLLKIIETINNLHPDIIFLGGDYVKGHLHKSSMPIGEIANALQKLHSRYGTYAVLGNHDSYYGKKQVADALKNAGIIVLDNEHTRIDINGISLSLAGIGDYYTDNPNTEAALNGTDAPTILLSHSPDIFPQLKNTPLLILSGHTHGGQVVLPLIGAPLVPSDYGRRYRYGLFIEGGKQMLVSKGLGTSILPLRFNCRPEIIFIEFE